MSGKTMRDYYCMTYTEGEGALLSFSGTITGFLLFCEKNGLSEWLAQNKFCALGYRHSGKDMGDQRRPDPNIFIFVGRFRKILKVELPGPYEIFMDTVTYEKITPGEPSVVVSDLGRLEPSEPGPWEPRPDLAAVREPFHVPLPEVLNSICDLKVERGYFKIMSSEFVSPLEKFGYDSPADYEVATYGIRKTKREEEDPKAGS